MAFERETATVGASGCRLTSSLAALAAVALQACSGDKVEPSTPEAPTRVSLPATAAATATDAGATSDSPKAPACAARPELAKGLAVEERTLLESICTVTRNPEGYLECEQCPSWTSMAGDRPGPRLQHVLEEPFVHPECREVLLDLVGCEAQANNGGGTVLAHAEGGRWQPVRYFAGLHANGCRPMPQADGHSRLACAPEWTGTGGGGTSVIVVDLRSREFAHLITAEYGTMDLSPSACHDWVQIKGHRVVDANADGHPDVAVDIGYDDTGKQCLSANHSGQAATLEFLAIPDRFGLVPNGSTIKLLAYGSDEEPIDPSVADAAKPPPAESHEIKPESIASTPIGYRDLR